MKSTRRLVISGLGAALAGCGARVEKPVQLTKLDTDRLSAGFPKLAARAAPAQLGLGVCLIGLAKAWASDPTTRFPMQSVFKAPMAAAVLSEVDAGRLKLSEPITLTELDLSPPVSAIDQAWPTPPDHHSLTLPAIDLLALALQRSDNTAADVIMKRIGGPGAVNAWLGAKSLGDIRVDRYERELQQDVAGMPPFEPAWKDERAWLAARDAVAAPLREAAMTAYLADPRDTATLLASLDFLSRLARSDLISPASTRLMMRLMTTSLTGANRLKAGLPAGASLAHKTGSARTDLGFTPATNDIGIVTLKNGGRLAIAAFLAGSTATEAQRDSLIADAARLAVSCVG